MPSITTILVDSQNVDMGALRNYFLDREGLYLPVASAASPAETKMEMQSVLKIKPHINEVGLGFVGDETETGLNWIHSMAFGLMAGGVQALTVANWGLHMEGNVRMIFGAADSYVNDNGMNLETVTSGNGTGGAMFTHWAAGDSASAALGFQKSGSATVGTHAAVVSTEVLGTIYGRGSDGTAFQYSQAIDFEVDGAVSAGIVPGRIKVRTYDAAGASVEALRIDSTQEIFMPAIGTTVSAANAFFNNGTTPANQLLRSTSTAKRKSNFGELSDKEIIRFEQLRPTLFTSLNWHDDPSEVFLGLTAENCYDVDPRLATLQDGEPEGVNDRAVLALTIAYTQRLARRVAALEKA